MDFGLISSALGAITAAKDIGKAALTVRDANLVAEHVSRLNDTLLKAQEALFAHNAQLLELQQEHFKATEELRQLKEAIAERGRYTLVELSRGQFAYRANTAPELGRAGEPDSTDPTHHICQQCFDGVEKKKVVLQRRTPLYGGNVLWCPSCKVEIGIPAN